MLCFIISCGGGGSGESIVYLAPVYNADYSQLTVVEGSSSIIRIAATDTNNRIVGHSIINGLDKEQFTLGINGQLSFINVPDYEAPIDVGGDNNYNITLQATAGQNTISLDVTISVKDAFEGRVVDGPISNATVFIDSNSDSIKNSSEMGVTTNSQGFFYIPKDSIVCNGICDHTVISQGGSDAQTGQNLNITFSSPLVGNQLFSVSPLSTLIVASTDDGALLSSLGIESTVSEVIARDLWQLAKDNNVSAKKLMRINYQLGMIFGATQSLFLLTDDLTASQISSKAAEKLVALINSTDKAILTKSSLNTYFTNMINELDPDSLFNVNAISSLAENLSKINNLLAEESSSPTSNGINELLTLSHSAFKNSIIPVVGGYLDESKFITRVSLDSIFSSTTVIKTLVDDDGDGYANIIDLNDDNDAIEDLYDAFPLDPNETIDTDSDGIGNNADLDDDADGVNDASDAYPLDKNVHTAPVATMTSWSVDILPKSLNSGAASLSGTAQDSRALTYTIAENASKGVVTITDNATGAFSYQTSSGVTGPTSDTFKYKVNDGFVDSAEAVVNISLKSDILYEHQWHLDNTGQLNFGSTAGIASKDINVDTVISEGYTGKGVKVAVVDSGLEINHEDLAANVINGGSFNFLDSSTDPTSNTSTGDHGTSVAGIIAAVGWNDLGVRGVAPDVDLKAFNMLKASSNANVISSLGGQTYSNDVDIFNLSYGFDNKSSGMPNSGVLAQYVDGITNLRGGKGAIYIKSAGNGFRGFGDPAADCVAARSQGVTCQNASMDAENIIPYQILVGALNASGTKTSYSTAGSAIWISAPGGEYGDDVNVIGPGTDYWFTPAIMTTDQSTCDKGYVRSSMGYVGNEFENKGSHSLNSSCNYTSVFNGTSSAAPVASGVVALLLEANPTLTWRDVKHILASSAVQVDANIAAVEISGQIITPAWTTNAAGYKFHNYYGFGGIDAASALNLAKNYSAGSLGTYLRPNGEESGDLNLAIPDNDTDGRVNTINYGGNLTIENLRVWMCLSHTRPSDIGIALTSPQGTRSVLLNPFTGLENTNSCFYLSSNAFYGESSVGDWEIKLTDWKAGTSGSIVEWLLEIAGR